MILNIMQLKECKNLMETVFWMFPSQAGNVKAPGMAGMSFLWNLGC